MESKLVKILRLKYEPVAILWSDEKPEKALQFAKGRWGCVMMLLASSAKGKTAVFDRETFGCIGGAVGLGFGNMYEKWPLGIECFYRFLSTGNKNDDQVRKKLENLSGRLSEEAMEDFLEGERYVKSPELVKKFVESLPIMDIPVRYVIFKPLNQLHPEKETPKVVVILANPDQISALVVLSHYDRDNEESVIVPMGAGCQQIGIFAFKQTEAQTPKAVLGLTDISARNNIKNQLGRELLSFTVPWKMFLNMERNVEGSFLERPSWKKLIGEKE